MGHPHPLQVRLPEAERLALTRAAEEDQRTVPAEVRAAVRDFLDKRARSKRAAPQPQPGALTLKELRAIGHAAEQAGAVPLGFEGLVPPLPGRHDRADLFADELEPEPEPAPKDQGPSTKGAAITPADQVVAHLAQELEATLGMGRLEAFLLARRVLVEGDGQAKAREELRQRLVQGQRADE